LGVDIINNSFQFGEVSRLMHARVDSPIYQKAAKLIRNMLVIPQGGAERRFGTKYVDTVGDHAGSPTYNEDYTKVKMFLWDYEDSKRYLLVFRSEGSTIRIDFYEDDELVAGQTKNLTSTWTGADGDDIANINITQTNNLVFLAHPDFPPVSISRTAATPVFQVNAITFSNYPTYDFDRNYDAITFSMRQGSGSTPITTSENVLGYEGNINASSPIFVAGHAGGLFFTDGGVVRITKVNSTTNVDVRILNTFDSESQLLVSPNTVLGKDCLLTEIAFSATRGYPSIVAFFQNRIMFAKTSSLPGGLWGSNFNGYSATTLDFDDSESLDTNAISTVLQGTKATIIKHIVAYKTLVILTSSGTYSTPLFIDAAITPANITSLNMQTSDSSNDALPVIFENDLIFIDKGGKKVKIMNVMGTTQHYETRTISVLAPHLIHAPRSIALYENSTIKDGTWLFAINEAAGNAEFDGSMATYQNVPEQEITAWTLSTTATSEDGTAGKFREVVSDEEIVYFLVERNIDGDTRLFIERLDFDVLTDAAVVKTGLGSTTITGLDYLEGESVWAIGLVGGNRAVVPPSTLPATTAMHTVAGGEITLNELFTNVEIGLDYEPELVPMPLNIPLPTGNDLYLPKSIKRVWVDFYESTAIKVNGDLIPPFRFGSDSYSLPADPVTDFVPVEPMTGWDPRAEISISQTVPMPMTIIGVAFSVAF